MKALINVILYDYETYLEGAFIIFDQTIQALGLMVDFSNEGLDQVIDCHGMWLIPGFINFHTHAYSTLAKGFDFKASPRSFTEKLEQIWWRLDRYLCLDDVYWSALEHAKASLKCGVVGVLDHHASRAIAGSTLAVEKAFKAVGLHGLTCFETSDRFDVTACIKENHAHQARQPGYLGLHASMTLCDQTLGVLRDTFKSCPLHVHVSESLDDHLAFDETPVKRLAQYDLLQKHSLLAHCVHITDEDVAMLKGKDLAIVVNPLSNQNNGVGMINTPKLTRATKTLLVGTDGLGVNVARSWQQLYFCGQAHQDNKLSLDQVLTFINKSYHYYQTVTGRALGTFKPGYAFDAVLYNYQTTSPVDDKNAFSHVFWGIYDGYQPQRVWVGGVCLVNDYQVLNTPAVPQKVIKDLWQRIEDNDEN